jgi:polyisoprenyl-teichoic acid--peptidoglycan teichoic acid transferase
MSTPQRPPRSRSPFAAAFLSLIFPGLGHAYAGAFGRALAFAALPLLSLALLGGIALRADKFELLGFVIQQEVLVALLVINLIVLVYRIVAAVDAWQVARFLNAADASGDGRLGRARLPLSSLSIAGLLAVILVMAGGHVAVARYNLLALDLVGCVFSADADPSCDVADESPPPGSSPDANSSVEPSLAPSESEFVPTPIPGGSGTVAPTLPPWDGKGKLNILLVGVDQRGGQAYFNTDTLIVVSIDPKTNQVAMFQIPRDTVNVPVPANARSFWGNVYGGKINAWYAENRNRTNLWAGQKVTTRGFNALKAILGELYGIDIPYYVMVNFQGFRDAVNTLGGVQINVQIPVAESDYPVGNGTVTRIYIPAGPQHMTGAQALIYARSRHRAQGGDFDRGRRQQRVIISLKEQMNASAILANLNQLVKDLKGTVNTDIPVSMVPKLLSLADGIDIKNVRSYVFSTGYYATDGYNSSGQYVIWPNVTRIRRAVKQAFSTSADLLDLRDRLGAEEARVWVLNGTGRQGAATNAADYLAYNGLDASAPNKKTATVATTRIVVYNGAESSMPETIKYLQQTYKVTVTTAVDPTVTVDMVITLGKDAPDLTIDAVG